MRTIKCTSLEDVDRNVLRDFIDYYADLFDINEKVIALSKKKVIQRKYRHEWIDEWYKHLTIPITLVANVIVLNDDYYLIFGFFDEIMKNRSKRENYPFKLINMIEVYDRLLLDSINIDRMKCLPDELRDIYAYKYFTHSRIMNDSGEFKLATYHFGCADYCMTTKCMLRSYQRTFDKFYHANCQKEFMNSVNSTAKDRRKFINDICETRSTIEFCSFDNSIMFKEMYWNNLIKLTNFTRLLCKHNHYNIYDFVGQDCDTRDYEYFSREHRLIINDICSIIKASLYVNGNEDCSNVTKNWFIHNYLVFPECINVIKLREMFIKLHAVWIDGEKEYIMIKYKLLTNRIKSIFNTTCRQKYEIDVVINWIIRLIGMYSSEFDPIMPESVRAIYVDYLPHDLIISDSDEEYDLHVLDRQE